MIKKYFENIKYKKEMIKTINSLKNNNDAVILKIIRKYMSLSENSFMMTESRVIRKYCSEILNEAVQYCYLKRAY